MSLVHQIKSSPLLPFNRMSRHTSYVDQRADKAVVVGFGEMRDGVIEKEVDRYTITCPECHSPGRYDELGEIVCENDACGVVISDQQPVINTEFSEGEGGMGQGRGLEKMSTAHSSHEPSV